MIKNDLITFGDIFLHSDPQSKSVDQLWQEFKQAVNKAVIDHVPRQKVLSFFLCFDNKKIEELKKSLLNQQKIKKIPQI